MALSSWLQSSAVLGRSKDFASLQSLETSLFSLLACHDHSDITITMPKPLLMQWHDFIPHTLHPLCCTHACGRLNSHSWFSARQVVFLFTVIETVWVVNIVIFWFPTLLCHLCLLIKGWWGGGKSTAKWFENILKTPLKMLKLSEHLQFGCATASPALEFPWN